MIENSKEPMWYAIYIHFIPPVWLQMAIKYVSGSA